MENNNKFTYRFLARIVIEAMTPIAVGSGEKDFMTDQLVTRDVNGLPYIPGTAIAGIVRHAIDDNIAERFLGCNITKEEEERKESGKKGQKVSAGIGSQIIFSSAQLIDKDNNAVEGLLNNPFKDTFLVNFKNLPIRQHVKITEKGTADNKGKFDEEVVFKGTRFCFEIEMLSTTTENETVFKEVLKVLSSDTFRIGSGTRSGHGEVKIVECKSITLDLKNVDDLKSYINKTSSLNDPFWKDINSEVEIGNNSNWTTYQLELEPEDFFLFGSGFGNENADMTYVTEECIDWNDKNIPTFKKDNILIPGSSVKGALSHRVAFYYNKLNQWFVGDANAKTGEKNEAVKALFGYAIDNDNVKRGNVIISDLIETPVQSKVLNHVSIDRFTGGAIEGALFSEEVAYGKGQNYALNIVVNNEAFKTEKVKEAFESALTDITTGMLPLGGGVNRGNGCFTGSWKIIN